jgi:hypothetical protein
VIKKGIKKSCWKRSALHLVLSLDTNLTQLSNCCALRLLLDSDATPSTANLFAGGPGRGEEWRVIFLPRVPWGVPSRWGWYRPRGIESVFAKMAIEPGIYVSLSDSKTIRETDTLMAGPMSSSCVANRHM